MVTAVQRSLRLDDYCNTVVQTLQDSKNMKYSQPLLKQISEHPFVILKLNLDSIVIGR